MNEEYLNELYKSMISFDSTYEKDVPFNDFVKAMANDSYAAQIYSYINELDPTFKQDISVNEFISSIKKKKTFNQICLLKRLLWNLLEDKNLQLLPRS